MFLQKRIKTSCHELPKDDKDRKKKKISNISKKNSIHLKSYSKEMSRGADIEVTPKKQTNKKKIHLKSHPNENNSRHMKSCMNYTDEKISEKQSRSITKRKNIKNNKLGCKLRTKTEHFNILCRCLTQYVKEQKKFGRNPNAQVFLMIKAFNSSQIRPMSKQLENLIKVMLEYVEETVLSQQDHMKSINTEKYQMPTQFSGIYQPTYLKEKEPPLIDKTAKKQQNIQEFNLRQERKVDKIKRKEQQLFDLQKSLLHKELESDVNDISEKLNSLRQAQSMIKQQINSKSSDKYILEKIIMEQQKDLMRIANSEKQEDEESDY